MRILVLGSSGQIGTHVMKRDAHDYMAHDISMGHPFDLSEKDPIYDALEEALGIADYCMFLAEDSSHDPLDLLHSNVSIMKNVFGALRESGVPFLYASSSTPDERHEVQLLKALGETYSELMGGVVVRFGTVYGDSDPLVGKAIDSALREGVITLETSGEESRQFLYGPDAAEALETVAEEHVDTIRTLGGLPVVPPLDITSFEWTKVKDMANFVASKTGATLEVGRHEGPHHIEPDPGVFDIIDWRPATTLNVGIEAILKERS